MTLEMLCRPMQTIHPSTREEKFLKDGSPKAPLKLTSKALMDDDRSLT
jgi:hypothetical protein